jgi:NAD-dependent dihydropyrimidine dehydrogenase PreA subunit
MPYVITGACSRDGACLPECATDSIEEGVYTDTDGTVYEQMFINPETCIDCGNCEVVCQQQAIYSDVDVPADQARFTEINRAYFAKV